MQTGASLWLTCSGRAGKHSVIVRQSEVCSAFAGCNSKNQKSFFTSELVSRQHNVPGCIQNIVTLYSRRCLYGHLCSYICACAFNRELRQILSLTGTNNSSKNCKASSLYVDT